MYNIPAGYQYPNYYVDQSIYYDYSYRNAFGEYQQITKAILDAIIGEATAIDFYSRLITSAPNQRDKDDINHALEDEKVHLNLFTQLYINLTGQQPVYQIKKEEYSSYKEGLKMAYNDELEAYEDYRNAYLLTQNQHIRDTFFRAFTDEIEHAIRFGFLLMSQQ
jgi:rubrerythrin